MQNELESNATIDNNEEHAGVENQSHAFTLGKGQKIAVFVLGIFTIVFIFMFVSNMIDTIKLPIGNYSKVGTEKELEQTKTIPSYAATDSDEAMQNKDTDNDGLSDWDELNVYKTSPYLEDSDSDGFSDGAEVNSGNNPNCPSGKDCGTFLDTTEVDNSANAVVLPIGNKSIGTGNVSGNIANVQSSNDDLQAILSGKSDAATLRKALLEYGVDKTMLDQVSDDDLLKGYQESLKK